MDWDWEEIGHFLLGALGIVVSIVIPIIIQIFLFRYLRDWNMSNLALGIKISVGVLLFQTPLFFLNSDDKTDNFDSMCASSFIIFVLLVVIDKVFY